MKQKQTLNYGKGKAYWVNNALTLDFKCSSCGRRIAQPYPVCPTCGKKMGIR